MTEEEEEVVKVKKEKKTEYEIHTFPEEGGFCVVTVQVTTVTLLLGGGLLFSPGRALKGTVLRDFRPPVFFII